MCGICGIVASDPTRLIERAYIEKMNRVLSHRGPDESNYLLSLGMAFGHQRLRVIDLETGKQPMQDATGRYTIVFNGEIYNYQDLRTSLESQGVRFRTSSDTEVLLQSYILKGVDSLKDFVGMFSFAIWDSQEKLLFAARDRVGKKPFYYSLWNQQFYFASEIKSILQVPGIPRQVEPSAIDAFFALTYIPAPQTAFQNILELPPAHWLTLKSGQIQVQSYWNPSFIVKSKISEEEAAETLWGKLKEATRIRMISDVPLGAFLSGGIDSSIIVALMSELSSKKIKTFSIGFEEMNYNELPFAKQVAEKYHTDHHEFVLRPNAADLMNKIVWHYDQPFSDVSAIPSFYVSQMARREVTVVLNGDGGDENFCGYSRYAYLERWEKLIKVPALFYRVLNDVSKLTFGSNHRYSKLFDDLKRGKLVSGYFRQMIQFREKDRRDLFHKDFYYGLNQKHPEEFIQDILESGHFVHSMDGFLLVDLLSYLPGDLLVKMDRASMAYGLEARSPFLDHRIIDFAATLPFSYKYRSGITKVILKRMMKNRLPQEILSRPKKGFGVPISHWFRTDLKKIGQEILMDSETLKRPYFQSEFVSKIWEEHQSGKKENGHRLWSLLMFELWHRQFIDQAPTHSGVN